jgi:hypothetical protein
MVNRRIKEQRMSLSTGPWPGQNQAEIVNIRAAIPAGSTQVNLGQACQNIRFQLDASSALLHIGLHTKAGPATTSMYAIPSGGTFHYTGPAIESFCIIGASALGNYNILAW